MRAPQRAAALAAAAVLLLAACAAAKKAAAGDFAGVEPVQVPGYNCPRACQGSCHCASHDIPGGLDPADTPQFVVLTNDDAITVTTMPVILDITGAHKNPDGCEIQATFFVSMNYTDYHLVQEVYMRGHEIASHTLHHVSNPDLFQIVGMKLWLNQTAHVPLEKIRGFRAPYLIHSPDQRAILQQNGFLYDSSIPEPFPTATSPDGTHRLWPYSMDYGLPQRCDLGTGPCSVNESWPGLWEIPMWDIQDDNGVVLTNMDPQGDIFEAYKREFDRSYEGNKAPVGVYGHAAWLMDPTRYAQMNQFIDYALAKDNVWFVSMSEVVEWMENPVSATEYAAQRKAKGCDPPTDMWFPTADGKFCQSVACVNGNWSDVACECTCTAEFIATQPGFCVDNTTKACTVAKIWDPVDRVFACPGDARRDPEALQAKLAAKPKPLDPSTANCGHGLQDFVGLGMSGTQDNAMLYSQALRAVDGLCDTCATADDSSGNYFTLTLPATNAVTKVRLTVGKKVEGAFIFVGDNRGNNGLDNPVCAMNLDLPKGKAVEVDCAAKGQYVTLATPKDLVLCDIFVDGTPLDPASLAAAAAAKAAAAPAQPVTGAGELPGSVPLPVPAADPSAATGTTPDTNPLLDQLLGTASEGSFKTTSADGDSGPTIDWSRVGMEGANPTRDPTHAQLTAQLTHTYEAERSFLEAHANRRRQ